MKHVIERGPDYTNSDPGDGSYPSASVECDCGWAGRLDDFGQHRRDNGLAKARTLNRTQRTTPHPYRATSRPYRSTR